MDKHVRKLIIMCLLIPICILILDVVDITRIIPLSQTYDWLGFVGSYIGCIIGGLVTYGTMRVTLDSQRKADQERRRLEIMPILEYELSYDKRDFDNSEGQLSGQIISHICINSVAYNDTDSLEWYYNLSIGNIGLGHARIKNIQFRFLKNGTDKIIHKENVGYVYRLVKTETQDNFMFLIYAPKRLFYRNGKLIDNPCCPLNLFIEYQDLLGNTYIQKVYTSIAVSAPGSDGSTCWNSVDLHYSDPFRKKEKSVIKEK